MCTLSGPLCSAAGYITETTRNAGTIGPHVRGGFHEPAKILGTAISTICHGLAQLNDQGKLAGRTVALGAHPSLGQRAGEAIEQKQAIASWAAAEVEEGKNILLDGGSTVGAMAFALRHRENRSVTTPGINAFLPWSRIRTRIVARPRFFPSIVVIPEPHIG
ncbi:MULTISPECIES: hypothetical protein [unclassified Arthrobacter]|uniref:hypothetical protein n=1 Tax=unclassified Arthrobacter TaxID=235627 RepID=UPI0027D8DE5E|nr:MULTISPECIES: hypothetical protein [unclassified Arthrobacter]